MDRALKIRVIGKRRRFPTTVMRRRRLVYIWRQLVEYKHPKNTRNEHDDSVLEYLFEWYRLLFAGTYFHKSYDKIDKCYCRGEHVHTIHSTIKFENVIIENTHMAH